MKRCTFKKIYFQLAFLILSVSTQVGANPAAPIVMSGKAQFENTNASTLTVRTGDRVVINWDSFSINHGELTRFVQPGKNSAALNRVTGGSRSEIFGALDANGRVYLINPNGILIDKDSQINAAAFLASTLDVTDSSFMQNGDLLFSGSSDGTVVNLGTINAFDGDVILLGFQVDNQGKIIAPRGTAGLAAGQEILLQVGGDKKFLIRPKKESTKTDLTGVNMGGMIQALRTEIQADGHAYNLAINHTGMIDATSVMSKNGQVYLCAPEGNTCINGAIHAPQGEVQILGNVVGMFDNTKIDTSYAGGGGNIYIGGGYQGSEPEKINAVKTYISSGVEIVSDALVTGDAGQVIVWSETSTQFYGDISAKGGTESGNGGFVEISSHGDLGFNGTADRTAYNGVGGTLLLDPRNITISSTATANISQNFAGPVDIFTVTNPALPANVGTATGTPNIATALTTGDVVILTQNDGGAGNGDISWVENSDLTVNTPFNLTLNSLNNIYMSSLYTNNGNGSFFLTAVNDITLVNTDPATTSVGVGANLLGTGGITLTGNNISLLSSTIPVELNNGGNILNGNITINASGGYIQQGGSVLAANALVNSTNGNIYLNALGGDAYIQGGSGGNTNASLVSTNENVVVNIATGSLYLEGGTNLVVGSFAQISSGLETSINTGLDLNLYGTVGTGSSSSINGSSVIITTGRDLNLVGGSGDFNSATIASVADGSYKIGNNLLLQGGSLDESFATITSAGGNLTFAVVGDVNLIAGTADNTFAQVGNNTTTNPVNISFNSIGGDLNLLANSNALGLFNNYAVIGNGSTNTSLNSEIGNISISGSNGSNLVLQGGALDNSNFAQIGNFAFSTATTSLSGNVSINGFGQAVSLNPAGIYALIGHGTLIGTVTNISGNIDIDLPGGDLNLNPGVNINSFAAVGFLNPTTSATGNVDVNLGTGELFMQPFGLSTASSSNAGSTIGFLNFANTPSAFGQINVNAGTVELMGSISPNNGAVIGFVNTGSILGSSSISVTANDNILLEAGAGTTFGSSNAVIGQLTAISGPNYIDSIAVTSIGGNVTLVGNSALSGGIALIGSEFLGTASDSNQAQSAVTVLAPNGTVGLYGSPQNSNSPGGLAIISTNALTQPYDLNITAGELTLIGGSALGGTGQALITSANNTFVNATGDFELNAQTGSAVFQTGTGQSSFKVGGDLILKGGSGASSIASIGTNLPLTNSADLTFVNVGGDVYLEAGSGSFASALIGHGPLPGQGFTGNLIGNIVFDNIGGNVTLLGNTYYAQIGHVGSTVSAVPLSGDIIFTNVDGEVSLTGGSGAGATAIIGHGNETTANGATSVAGSIAINAGAVSLQGGSNVASNAVIGFDSAIGAPPIIQSNGITVTSADGVSLTAGLGNGTTIAGGSAVIGYYNPNQTANVVIDTINVTAKSGDITLTAGFAPAAPSTAAFIGTYVALAGTGNSEIKVTTPGNLILNVPSSASLGLAAIYNSAPNSRTALDVSIDPAEVILLSGTASPPGTAAIYSSNNLNLDFVDSLDINYDKSNPTIVQTGSAFVRANNSVFINTDKPSLGTVTIQGPSSLAQVSTIEALNGDVIIGTRHATGAGIVNVGTGIQVGPAAILSDFGNLAANVQGPVNVMGGVPVGSNSTIAGFKNLNLKAFEDINLISAGLGGSTITSTSGNLTVATENDVNNSGIIFNDGGTNGEANIYAKGSVNVPGGSIENFGNGDTNVKAGQDVNITNAGDIFATGTGDVNVTAGRDFDLSASNLSSGGGINVNTGRDINLTDGSIISQTIANTSGIEMNAGRNLTITTTTGPTTISQLGTGETALHAGQDFVMNLGSSLTTAGLDTSVTAGRDLSITGSAITQTGTSTFTLNAGEDVNLLGATTITTAAESANFSSGQDFNIAVSTITQTGTSTFTLNAGEDTNISAGTSITTAAENASLSSAQNFNLTDSSITHTGSNTFALTAGDNTNLNASSITTSAQEASIAAEEDIVLTGSAIIHTGTSSFTANAGEDLTLADSFVSTAANDTTLAAGQDANFSGNSSVVQTGVNNFHLNAGDNVNFTDTASVYTAADNAFVKAGQDINFTGDNTFAQIGDSIFNFTSGENISVGGSTTITTNAENASFNAADNITFSGTSSLTQPGNQNILNFNSGGYLTFTDFTKITTSANAVNLAAALDVTFSGNSVLNQTGESTLDVSGENLIMSQNGRLTTNSLAATFDIDVDMILSGNAEINFNSDGVQIYNVGQDIELHDNSFISTITGTSFFNAGRDYVMTGRSKILNFDSRRLEIHAKDNIDLSDHALIDSFGGELLAVANYNITLDDYAQINNTFGNITLVVDNQWPISPSFGDGSFKLLRHTEINAPHGTIRVFTSRRAFNQIRGTLNGHHFHPGILFLNSPTEQWCTYFDHAIKGVPFTIFYKDCGVPHFPPKPLTAAQLEQFLAAISEGFHDWKYYDYFDYALLCMDIIDDCYSPGTCCVEYDAMHLKLLREVFHNRHTLKYNLPF